MSKKRNRNARRGKKMPPQRRARPGDPLPESDRVGAGAGDGARNPAREAQDPVRPGLFPPSRRPPRDPDRKPWETYACMVMAVLIVFLLPDWRDPENPWPAWFRAAPLAFGVLGALFALLDKRRRLAAISAGAGVVLFLGLLAALALYS